MIFYDFRCNLKVGECLQQLISAFGNKTPSKSRQIYKSCLLFEIFVLSLM